MFRKIALTLALTVVALTLTTVSASAASASTWTFPRLPYAPLTLVCRNKVGKEVSFRARRAPGITCRVEHRPIRTQR